MHSPVVLVTHSRRLFDRMRSAAPAGVVHQVTCLAETPADATHGTVMVDPRAIDPSCLRTLAGWRRTRAGREIVYLDFQAPAARLVSLPRIHPGSFLEVERAIDRLRRLRQTAGCAGVWDDWPLVLGVGERDARARAFLHAALRLQAPAGVPEAAAAMRVGERHLTRLCRVWFGYPPGVIIRQARLLRVARELIDSRTSLADIARRHGFSSRQAMTRLFSTVSGLSPGRFRRERLASRLAPAH
jgi:AraC-like DNA-binding protein